MTTSGTIIPLANRIGLREMFFAFLTTRPQYRNPDSCRKFLVGPMRELLNAQGSELKDVWPDAPARARAMALIEARGEADRMLADFCARCGRCKWGLMPGPADTDPDADRGP